MDKQEYLSKWSEKLSLPIEEIESEFSKVLKEEESIHPDSSTEQRELRTLQRLALMYKKQLRSPAVGFEGIIIGIGECNDIVARQKREATELFKTDPQTAISEGVTNEEGIPLDTREEWSTGRVNPQYGKPLPEHNYLRNVWGIVTKTKAYGEPRFFSMTLSGDKATDESIPTFKPLRFMGIDKSKDEAEYRLNASQFTKFVEDEKLNLPDYEELLEKYIGIIPLKDLESYHSENKDDFNRIVAIEGDVSMLNLEPTAFGSRIMGVEDSEASLEDLDAKGVTCWLPMRTEVNFAEGSRVLVIGRTTQGKKKDELGNATEELGDVTINVYGLYALPEFKVELPDEIKPITEESLQTEMERQTTLDESEESPAETPEETAEETPEETSEETSEETPTETPAE